MRALSAMPIPAPAAAQASRGAVKWPLASAFVALLKVANVDVDAVVMAMSRYLMQLPSSLALMAWSAVLAEVQPPPPAIVDHAQACALRFTAEMTAKGSRYYSPLHRFRALRNVVDSERTTYPCVHDPTGWYPLANYSLLQRCADDCQTHP